MTKAKEDPSEYVLERLHDLEEINYTRRQNSASWRALLPEEDYVAREFLLGKAKIASSEVNRLAVFGLRSQDKLQLVSSIELLIRESCRFTKNEDGTVTRKSILSGCVGGVYTYPEYRGKGLATIMVDKLVEIAKTKEYLGEDGFIFLYSEVGEYYTRNGFKSYAVPLMNVPLQSSSNAFVAPENMSLVKYHEFGPLFDIYKNRFEEDMHSSVGKDGVERISIDPTEECIDWFHLRVKFFGTKLFGDVGAKYDVWKDSYELLVSSFEHVQPTHFGIRYDCPKTGKLIGFIVWTYDYSFNEEKQKFQNHATIIKIFVDTPEQDAVTLKLIGGMKSFLEAKHEAAAVSNFTRIVIWESEISDRVHSQLVKLWGAVHGLENGSRSAIRFNNVKDDEKLKSGAIVWENNNKMPWF